MLPGGDILRTCQLQENKCQAIKWAGCVLLALHEKPERRVNLSGLRSPTEAYPAEGLPLNTRSPFRVCFFLSSLLLLR